jgi:2-dehydro-3-deoxyphosphooctonate aldolase (KDO 8-P synthase)
VTRRVVIADGVAVGGGGTLAVIAGPCVLETLDLAVEIAESCRRACTEAGLPYVFKASFDKANRTSASAFRGMGLDEGLGVLAEVRERVGVPVLTDVHEPSQAEAAADVVDIIQIPAFLSRQTDLLTAAVKTGKVVNVKKGQFLAPWDMRYVVEKLEQAGATRVLLTERGASFGYNALVVDFRALPIMRGFGYPVVFDATHSVQIPGGGAGATSGERQYIAPLARAAVAVGVDALFLEVHPEPDRAPSDGPNMLRLDDLPALLADLVRIRDAVS